MMADRTLAFVGIGLYALQVLTSVSDAKGNSQAPEMLILFSGTASLIYVAIVSVRFWKNGAQLSALALSALTLASMVAFLFQTESNSNANLIVNGLKVAAFLTYVYAMFLLFEFDRRAKKQASTQIHS